MVVIQYWFHVLLQQVVDADLAQEPVAVLLLLRGLLLLEFKLVKLFQSHYVLLLPLLGLQKVHLLVQAGDLIHSELLYFWVVGILLLESVQRG